MLDPERHEEYVEPAVSPEIVASHGLTTDEYQKIVKTLRREPRPPPKPWTAILN